MKLNLLFTVMDLLILLAYPIVFVHGKLLRLSKLKESIPVTNFLIADAVTPGKSAYSFDDR